MLSHHQHRWLQWLEGVLDDPGNGGYEVETQRAEAVAEINRRDFLGLDGEVVPSYRLSFEDSADYVGWVIRGRQSGELVYPCGDTCWNGCRGRGVFCGVDLEDIPCDDAGLREVLDRIGEALAPDLVEIVWVGHEEVVSDGR